MNGSYSYKDRNNVVNIAEVLFEAYCQTKNYFYRRLGFDEKNDPIPNFYNLNPLIRNLPDFYIHNPLKNASALIMVKGTRNLKQSEFDKYLEQFFEGKLEAKHILLLEKIIKHNDPSEINVVMNEFAFQITQRTGNLDKALYWLNWILEWEKLNIKKAKSVIGSGQVWTYQNLVFFLKKLGIRLITLSLKY
mgnify:CR=1 FL=1